MAGIPKNYYTKKMKKLNMKYESNTGICFKIFLDFTPQGIALDKAQDALDAAVWNDVQRYMPLDTGSLKSETNVINVYTRGRVYAYPPNSDYGHYQYEGVVYVDPVTKKAAMFNPEHGFWSKPGVKKEASNRLLEYSQPEARREWAKYAYDHHHNEWLEVVKRALS